MSKEHFGVIQIVDLKSKQTSFNVNLWAHIIFFLVLRETCLRILFLKLFFKF